MAEYTPTKIGIGPQSTGLGVPAYNAGVTNIGVAVVADYTAAVTVPTITATTATVTTETVATSTITALTVPKLGANVSPNMSRIRFFEDFLQDASSTLQKPWGTQDTSSAGAPTATMVADALNGEYAMTLAADSEAETLTLYFADQLVINPLLNPIFECRMKLSPAGATLTADERVVFGFSSARNATLDSATTNVWFRLEGANLNIYAESDDGTTDTDDTDTTIDYVKGTYVTLKIDMADTSAIKFYVNGVLGATLSAPLLDATMKLQPFIEIQRDAGTETNVLTLDYVYIEQDRV